MKKNYLFLAALACAAFFCFNGCASKPEGAKIVGNIDKARYLGLWYEIARLDFVFEENLNNTSAEYSLLEDGALGVLNRGYNYKTGKWQESRGRARFKKTDTLGELEVSFFGPFYSAYNIIALDNDYSYALVAGSSTKFLWFLSREKTMPDEIKDKYLELAKTLGYNTENLIWVEHEGS